MAPDEEEPASGGGPNQGEGDHQADASSTSGGGLEGGEVPGEQMQAIEGAADAQARQGAAIPADMTMEDQAPPRGVPPLRQPPQTGSVLQTVAQIAWLARIMGVSSRQAQAPPLEQPSSEADADVPATDEEAEDLAQMSGEPTSRGQMRQLGELLQRQVQIDQAQQQVEPQVASPAAAQRSSSELSQELSQERQIRQQLERQLRPLKEQLAQAPVSSRGGGVASLMVPRQLQVGRPQAVVQRPSMVRPPPTVAPHTGIHPLSQQLVSGPRTYAQAAQAQPAAQYRPRPAAQVQLGRQQLQVPSVPRQQMGQIAQVPSAPRQQMGQITQVPPVNLPPSPQQSSSEAVRERRRQRRAGKRIVEDQAPQQIQARPANLQQTAGNVLQQPGSQQIRRRTANLQQTFGNVQQQPDSRQIHSGTANLQQISGNV